MYDLDGNGGETMIAEGGPQVGSFDGFAADGDYIVWSFVVEPQAWLYTISTGTKQAISDRARTLTEPRIVANTVMWNVERRTDFRHPLLHSVVAYDISTGTSRTVVEEGTELVRIQGMLGSQNMVLTAAEGSTGPQALYLTSLETRSLRFVREETAAASGATLQQDSTEHVRIEGRDFKVGDAIWDVDGVHLILPQYGINGRTFGRNTIRNNNGELFSIQREIDERRAWLDIAEKMGVKTVRIFVDLPGEFAPANYEDIFWFTYNELRPRGMRLALVVHNSGTFEDIGPPPFAGLKQEWIRDLIDCFAGTFLTLGCPEFLGDQTHLIAYISADNEINNHPEVPDSPIEGNPNCQLRNGEPVDCYKQDDEDASRRYVIEAHEWVRKVRDAVKAKDPEILVTVGMGTNFTDPATQDILVAVDNYFSDGGDEYQPLWEEGRSDNLVDFIAPHHYGSFRLQEYLIDEIDPDYKDSRPTLIEEYGYYTDPEPQDPNSFYDGPLSCRNAPPSCGPESAPNTINKYSLDAIDRGDFAGGIAFMLADVTDKDDGSQDCGPIIDPQAEYLSPDLFTGLVAINDDYRCGGTQNNGLAQIKNTGYVVCQFYGGSDCSLDPAPFPSCPGRGGVALGAANTRIYLPLISNTTGQDDGYYQNFPPLCP